jgi:hypothetical protein
MTRTNDVAHRRIFEKYYGRKIMPGYHIHHKDGDHTNNDPLNLVEVTALDHYIIHKERGDWGACILLSRAAGISPEELYELQRLHGKKCAEDGIGIHDPDFDHSKRSKDMWDATPPGRKSVTDGEQVRRWKTEEEVELFLASNPSWRRGLPNRMKVGLKTSTRRLTSLEAKQIAEKRLSEGQHNFIVEYTCPNCGHVGKGPMMKRWHFDNCKHKKEIL